MPRPPARPEPASMRLILLTTPFKRLSRLLTLFSVRTRIVVLALIPVAGFIANGLTYVAGESAVGTAFQSVHKSAVLSDASRDFKIAIAAMRIAAKDFAVSPHAMLIGAFEQSQQEANKSPDTIEATIGGVHTDEIKVLRGELTQLKKYFDQVVAEQK